MSILIKKEEASAEELRIEGVVKRIHREVKGRSKQLAWVTLEVVMIESGDGGSFEPKKQAELEGRYRIIQTVQAGWDFNYQPVDWSDKSQCVSCTLSLDTIFLESSLTYKLNLLYNKPFKGLKPPSAIKFLGKPIWFCDSEDHNLEYICNENVEVPQVIPSITLPKVGAPSSSESKSYRYSEL